MTISMSLHWTAIKGKCNCQGWRITVFFSDPSSIIESDSESDIDVSDSDSELSFSDDESDENVNIIDDNNADSKLSPEQLVAQTAVLELFELHVRHNTTQSSVVDTLKTLRAVARPELLPYLPQTYAQALKLLPRLSPVQRIDVCKNQCQLFTTPRSPHDVCGTCGAPRLDDKGRPWLVFRYMALAPRLQRIFQHPVRSTAFFSLIVVSVAGTLKNVAIPL